MDVLERVRPIVEAKLQSMGYELYALKFFNAGKHSVLRVFVDKAGGITVEDCERVSHEISILLDVEDFLQGSYSLEVSSPGTDWPLKSERDYRRVIGKEIVADLIEPLDGVLQVHGTVVWCLDNSVTLDVGGKRTNVPLAKVAHAKVEIRFK